jgi:hypothetical protein
MGFMDKLKGAVNAVTGNAAKVTLEFTPAVAYPGDVVQVKISATSTGNELKSKGVYIDLQGNEEIRLKQDAAKGRTQDQHETKHSEQEFQVAPAFVLAANETKTWEGQFTLPATAQPSFQGTFSTHGWQLRARIEATGNDPDSGFKPIRIGLKS